MYKYIALIFTMLCILGCQKPITEGTIYDKRFRAAYTETGMECKLRNFENYSCTVWGTYTRHHPDRWKVCFHHEAEGKPGKYRDRCVEVAQSTFDEYDKGIYVTLGELR